MIVTEQLNFYTSVGFIIPFVLFVLVSLVLTKRRKQNINNIVCDDLVDQWTPEPLTGEISKDELVQAKYILDKKCGSVFSINNKTCVNFATHNYLSLVENKNIEEASIKCIKNYGVGSCGPRGFYGTAEVHLDLEKELASFLGLEEAVLYSYGFSTSASAMAAYIKKNDAVFADEGIQFALQTGLIATRCKIQYFKHNNMSHLEELLKQQDEQDKLKKQVSSKFIIVEGVYANYGDICPIREIIKLREKYQARLFLDESFSFGVLGDTGRGVTEYFGVSTEEIDMIIGSLENSLGSIGGFCGGSSFVIEHHTLSGPGYCFSASSPPFLAVAASTSLKIIKEDPSIILKLRNNCRLMHNNLMTDTVSDRYIVKSNPDTPLKFLYLHTNSDKDETLLKSIAEFCLQSGFAVATPYYNDNEFLKPKASIRVTCHVAHSEQNIKDLVTILIEAHDTCINGS